MLSVIILCNIWLESHRRQYKSRLGAEGAQNLIRDLLSEEGPQYSEIKHPCKSNAEPKNSTTTLSSQILSK